jgi:hypothetical protein
MTCDEELRKFWDSLPGGVFDVYHLGDIRVVAVKGIAGDWAAYIGSGSSVASTGTKLNEKQARSFFTQAFIDCGSYRGY